MADLLQRICDACNTDEQTVVAAHSVALTVSGSHYRLDLCEQHFADLWQPVLAVLDGAVTTIEHAEPAPRRGARSLLACIDCGETKSDISSLVRHRQSEHGFTAYWFPQCPYCTRKEFADMQSLSAHVSNAHRDAHRERVLTQPAGKP